MADCSRGICSHRSDVVSLTPGDSSCCQLVASMPLMPLRLPSMLLWPPRLVRLPPLQLPGCRECNALGPLLVPLSMRVLVAALVGASLCHPLLLPATLSPSELAASLSLALELLALLVASLLAPPLEVVLGAVLDPSLELAPAPLSQIALSWWWRDAPSEVLLLARLCFVPARTRSSTQSLPRSPQFLAGPAISSASSKRLLLSRLLHTRR